MNNTNQNYEAAVERMLIYLKSKRLFCKLISIIFRAMLDFNRCSLENFAVHYIGNKGNGEEASFSKKEFVFKQDFVKDSLMTFFLQP